MFSFPLLVSLVLLAESATECPTEIIHHIVGTPDPVYSTYETTNYIVTPYCPSEGGPVPPSPPVVPPGTYPTHVPLPTMPPPAPCPTMIIHDTVGTPDPVDGTFATTNRVVTPADCYNSVLPTVAPPTTSIHPHPTSPPSTTPCPSEIIYDTVGTPDPVYSTYETTRYIITPYCPSKTPQPPTPPTAQGPKPTPECPTAIIHDTVGTPDPVDGTYATTSRVVTPADCGFSTTKLPTPPSPAPPTTSIHPGPSLPPTTACPTGIIYDTVGTPDPVYSTYQTTSYIVTPYCPSEEPPVSPPKPPCSRVVNGRCLPPTTAPTVIPTVVPTVVPTAPTTAPTVIPTVVPTVVPTAPTVIPTVVPTVVPTTMKPPIVCSQAANGRCLPPTTTPAPTAGPPDVDPRVVCFRADNLHRLRGSVY